MIKKKEIREFGKLVHKDIKNRYNKPTPKWIKRTADVLLTVSGAITITGIAQGNDLMSYIATGCGLLGKLLSNWFVE